MGVSTSGTREAILAGQALQIKWSPMKKPVLVMIMPLPFPELTANGQTVETRQFEGDFSIFDQAEVIC